MNIEIHGAADSPIAEIISDRLVISNAEDGKNLLGDLYYQGFDRMIVHEKNLTPDFFDLKNGMAGEILQKFSNYRVRLAIVGDFDRYQSQSIRDFMFESNRHGQICFVDSVPTAISRLLKTV